MATGATNEGSGVRKKTHGPKYGPKLRFKTTGPGPSGDVLIPQVAVSYGVRLSAIPEAYWGAWVPAADVCHDANKSAIVLLAKAYVTSAVSCAVNYVAETPTPKGPIYSARLQCSNGAGRAPKKAANLIIRPGETNQIAIGPAFDSLKLYQRCSANGEVQRP
jgi:hypothetical protein